MISPVLHFISFIVNLMVLTIVLYVAGFIVVGKKRAQFSDAFVIPFLERSSAPSSLFFFLTFHF